MARENRKKRMMTPDPAAPDATRRSLLTGGALTVAASAAVIGRASAGEPEPQDADERRDRNALQYRETDHIAAYYARARE